MSDEIHLMGIGPGRILDSLPVGLGRPRQPSVIESPEFARLASRLRRELHDAMEADDDD